MCDVIGKLQYTSDLQWSLNVVVTDNGQDQISVKLSDEVCNGVTPQTSQGKKKCEIKSDDCNG